MGGKGKEAAQRLLAIIVIIAMMSAMGIPPPVIIFFAIVIYFVWRAVQHTERQETNRIFEFYHAANEILRDEERRWYGYEIADVREEGERILREMPDAPPLVLYALGALYTRTGDYGAAHEHLARLVESDAGDESRRQIASPELRRYVDILRRLEREPADKPQTMAAVRSLERARRHQAAPLLEHARARIAAGEVHSPRAAHAVTGAQHTIARQATPAVSDPLRREAASLVAYIAAHAAEAGGAADTPPEAASGKQASPTHRDDRRATATRAAEPHEDRAAERPPSGEPRAPISEVLRELYEEKKTA